MKTPVLPVIDFRYVPGLARLFSSNVIRELATKGFSPFACEMLSEYKLSEKLNPSMMLRDFYDALFTVLFRTYRNEYVYKNVIADKVLLGTHSLNSSFMLTEFRAGNCKADTVVLNGSSCVYEIKSAFDSMNRLERQINAYQKIFDHVNVITSEDQLEKVQRVAGESVGLMVLNKRYAISTVRRSASCKGQTDPSAIFDSLRKHEYMEVVEAQFGNAPEVPNTLIYKACKALFVKLGPEVAHDEMVRVLKKRGDCCRLKEFVTGVPDSLKAASLACKLSHREKSSFLNLLDDGIGNCLLTPCS